MWEEGVCSSQQKQLALRYEDKGEKKEKKTRKKENVFTV